MPCRILLATTNPAKQARLRWLLDGLGLTCVTPEETGVAPPVEEEGATHREVAARKAGAWSRAFGGLALASDGGALIPALGTRWDSLRTRRFAGEAADDRARVEALLRLLEPCQGQVRRIAWREAGAVADAGRVLGVWEAEGGEGVVARTFDPRRVNPGFWVATVWCLPALGKRYLECTEEELARAGDPWAALKPQVQAFLRGL